jgi:hypothetical protein
MQFYCCESRIALAKEAFNKARELLAKGKGKGKGVLST